MNSGGLVATGFIDFIKTVKAVLFVLFSGLNMKKTIFRLHKIRFVLMGLLYITKGGL